MAECVSLFFEDGKFVDSYDEMSKIQRLCFSHITSPVASLIARS